MAIEAPLPWQRHAFETFAQARAAGRLPHALLVTGPRGVGKRALVGLIGRSLLCRQPDAGGLACRRCRECELLAAGTHPDYRTIGPDPEGKSDEIKVDAIRGLTASEALTAHRGGWKLVVIDPAQNMNASAANSLLKTLEEPSPDTLLCLVCEHPERLPATVRSRCQQLKVPVPPTADACAWLAARTDAKDLPTLLCLARGAPLEALALLEEGRLPQREAAFAGFVELARGLRDPLAQAVAWNELDPTVLLDWLGGWVSDLLRLASGHASPRLLNPDKAEALRGMAKVVSPQQAHGFLEQVWRARAHERSAVNRLLLCEALAVAWARVAGRGT